MILYVIYLDMQYLEAAYVLNESQHSILWAFMDNVRNEKYKAVNIGNTRKFTSVSLLTGIRLQFHLYVIPPVLIYVKAHIFFSLP
jgi:hypothetical protein